MIGRVPNGFVNTGTFVCAAREQLASGANTRPTTTEGGHFCVHLTDWFMDNDDDGDGASSAAQTHRNIVASYEYYICTYIGCG